MNRIRRNSVSSGASSWPMGCLRLLTAGTTTTLMLFGSYSLMTPTAAIAQTSASITYPVLSAGSTGDSVSRLQATLKLLGFYSGSINGNYNESTQAAVARFQTAAGIPADGITGPSTWQRLLPTPSDVANIATAQPVASTQPNPTPVEPTPVEQPAEAPAQPQGPPILRPNVEGSAVSQLQRELQQLGYYNGEIDGVYGDLTQSAVKNFQSDKGLAVDAIVGPSTWDALTRALD